MPPSDLPAAADPQVELAKQRNHLAADRTLLAWARLSLTMIGIGFGVEQTVGLLYQAISDGHSVVRPNQILGLLLVGLGLYALGMAIVDYRQELRRLHQPDYVYTPRSGLGARVAIALAAIAALGCLTISYRLLRHHWLA
ncbi:MAG TPA: DUF202 domain-containing protein [Candidatus Obscuribacterales bacterium]